MLILPGYETLEQIYESANSCVYRAIKTLYNLNAYAEAAQRFEDCLRQNPSDRVAQIYLKRTQAKI